MTPSNKCTPSIKTTFIWFVIHRTLDAVGIVLVILAAFSVVGYFVYEGYDWLYQESYLQKYHDIMQEKANSGLSVVQTLAFTADWLIMWLLWIGLMYIMCALSVTWLASTTRRHEEEDRQYSEGCCACVACKEMSSVCKTTTLSTAETGRRASPKVVRTIGSDHIDVNPGDAIVTMENQNMIYIRVPENPDGYRSVTAKALIEVGDWVLPGQNIIELKRYRMLSPLQIAKRKNLADVFTFLLSLSVLIIMLIYLVIVFPYPTMARTYCRSSAVVLVAHGTDAAGRDSFMGVVFGKLDNYLGGVPPKSKVKGLWREAATLERSLGETAGSSKERSVVVDKYGEVLIQASISGDIDLLEKALEKQISVQNGGGN